MLKRKMITLGLMLILATTSACGVGQARQAEYSEVQISSDQMLDKIKGGWVGQTVGVCYGGPTEFAWNSTLIPDYVPINYNANILKRYFNNDDLYMDLAFLTVLDSLGLDASADAMALQFANAGFTLWHANQAGRWNILNGIMPPESGHWKNNPHADDIDFQIEADFIGLLNPGMPNTAYEYCDKVGHIMNYGDGFYGGVFVAAMYTHAFFEDDVAKVVELGLQSLPEQSNYYKCIADVISWWRQHPESWKDCWFEVQKKWNNDIGCPKGVHNPFNIDAKINGAYIAIGLLYGNKDFGKTIDIATRCGDDSDCNPSNAGGILGTMLGFQNIPERWKVGLDAIEDVKFGGGEEEEETDDDGLGYQCAYSLNDVYQVNYRLAAELVQRNGGSVDENTWTIKRQQPVAPEVAEVSFEGLEVSGIRWPSEQYLDGSSSISFTGKGYVLDGWITNGKSAECEFYVDGKLIERVELSGDYQYRRTPLSWNYDLDQGSHELVIKQVAGEGIVRTHKVIVYK